MHLPLRGSYLSQCAGHTVLTPRETSDRLTHCANVRLLFGRSEKHAVVCSGKAFKLCTHKLSWSYFPVFSISSPTAPHPCMFFVVANWDKQHTETFAGRRTMWLQYIGLYLPQVSPAVPRQCLFQPCHSDGKLTAVPIGVSVTPLPMQSELCG